MPSYYLNGKREIGVSGGDEIGGRRWDEARGLVCILVLVNHDVDLDGGDVLSIYKTGDCGVGNLQNMAGKLPG